MALRDQFTAEMKEAMRAGDKLRLETIRMVIAALKERDIEARTSGKPVDDDMVMAMLQKLIKQRQESAKMYVDGGRQELANKENAEIAVIAHFLPQQMDDAAVKAAIASAIAATGATAMKDMGKVVAELKGKYAGQMDFAKASGLVKTALGG